MPHISLLGDIQSHSHSQIPTTGKHLGSTKLWSNRSAMVGGRPSSSILLIPFLTTSPTFQRIFTGITGRDTRNMKSSVIDWDESEKIVKTYL